MEELVRGKHFAELLELVDIDKRLLHELVDMPSFHELVVERLASKQHEIEAIDFLFRMYGFFDDPDVLVNISGLAEPLLTLCLHESGDTKWKAISLLHNLIYGLDMSVALDELPECALNVLFQLADDDGLNAHGGTVGENSTLTSNVLVMLRIVISGREDGCELTKGMLDMLLKRLHGEDVFEMITAYDLAECLVSDKPENALFVLCDDEACEVMAELVSADEDRNSTSAISNFISLLAQECPREFLQECSTDFLSIMMHVGLSRHRLGLKSSAYLKTINSLLAHKDNLPLLFNQEGLIQMLVECMGCIDPLWTRDVACATLCHLLSAKETVQFTMDRIFLIKVLIRINECNGLEMNRVEARRALKVVHSLQSANRVLANDQVIPFWRAALPMWALLSSRRRPNALNRLPTELFRLVFSMLL